MLQGAEQVQQNIVSIYEQRRAAVYALCRDYAALVLSEFRARQLAGPGHYWSNKTFSAAKTVFAEAFQGENIYGGETVLGFFLAHAVDYGVYLEISNDHIHAALRPLIEEFFPKFKADLVQIYAD